MRMFTTSLCGALVLFLAAIPAPRASGQTPLDTTFLYQGVLNDENGPVDEATDFTVRLFDAAAGGAELGGVSLPAAPVNDGQFALELDFGLAFNDENRWLEVSVRAAGSGEPFTTLAPRQQIRATPFALFALNGNPGPVGPTGPGGPAGPGVPTGGESGQIVYKIGTTDFATTWGDAPVGRPIGGTTGQVLTKATDGDFSAQWADAPVGSGPLLAAAIGLPGAAAGTDQFVTVSSATIVMPQAGRVAASVTYFGEQALYSDGCCGGAGSGAAVQARLLIGGVVVASGNNQPLSNGLPASGSVVGTASVGPGPIDIVIQVRYGPDNGAPYLPGGVLRSFGIMAIGP